MPLTSFYATWWFLNCRWISPSIGIFDDCRNASAGLCCFPSVRPRKKRTALCKLWLRICLFWISPIRQLSDRAQIREWPPAFVEGMTVGISPSLDMEPMTLRYQCCITSLHSVRRPDATHVRSWSFETPCTFPVRSLIMERRDCEEFSLSRRENAEAASLMNAEAMTDEQRRTPLPKMQIAVLLAVQLAEPVR